MKKTYFAVCFIIFVFAFSVCVCAEEGETLQTPDSVYEILGGSAEDFIASGSDVSQAAKEAVIKVVPTIKLPFFTLLAVLVLSALLRAVKESFGAGQSEAYELASCLVCTILVFGAVKESCVLVKTCLETMTAFMTSMLAVMCTSWGMSGQILTGTYFTSNMMLVLQAISLISSYFVMPMSYSCFSLSLASSLSDKPDVMTVISFLKKAVSIILTAAGTLVVFLLSFQTAFAATGETVIRKGVKFAASSFIPIVGSSLSESVDAVFESMNIVKTTSSLSALLVLLIISLPCAAVLVFNKLLLSCSSFAAGLLSLPKQAKIFNGVNSLLSVLLATLLVSATVLMIGCALFMKVRYA